MPLMNFKKRGVLFLEALVETLGDAFDIEPGAGSARNIDKRQSFLPPRA